MTVKAYYFVQAACPDCGVLLRVAEDRDYLECSNHMCEHAAKYPRPYKELAVKKREKVPD